jgi:GNAT superfamily N-acetyltransferase
MGFYAMTVQLEQASNLDRQTRGSTKSQGGFFSAVQLCSVAVEKAMQRQGFGTVLMGAALHDFYEIVVRTGIYAMTLMAANRDVVDFYSQLGFVVYGDPESHMPKMILPAASVIEIIERDGATTTII